MNRKTTIAGILIVLAAGIFFSYYPAFFAGYTNWDDPSYVVENPMIRELSSEATGEMFTSFRNGHYHPLTWLSLAIDYQLGDGKPGWFHFTGVFIHFLNTILLFFFLFGLLKEVWKAFAIACLFAVHPMSVEAVAWISERKTILYVFFLLLSLLAYLRYSEKPGVKRYLWVLFFFVLSCLSKSMAVVLPLLLVLIDYYQGKAVFSLRKQWDKIPLFGVSILIGVLSIMAQQGVMKPEHVQSFTQNAGWGAWSFLLYLIKMAVPAELSAFYAYPPDGSVLSIKVIAGSLTLLAFCGLIIYGIRKQQRTLVFSLLFLLVNLFFVLKFFNIPAGAYYMADRYAYLPAAGLWLAFVSLADLVPPKRIRYAQILIVFIALAFVVSAHQRSRVWKNSIVLWTDVIEKHPDATVAYINRGNAYREKKQYEQAILDYTSAERNNPRYAVIFTHRGLARFMTGKYTEAEKDYSRSLVIQPGQPEVLYNRGLVYDALKQYDKAIADYTIALKTDPSFHKARLSMGNAWLAAGNDSMAVVCYSDAITNDPTLAEAYYNRANIRARNKSHREALGDYNKAIELAPSNPDYRVNRANTYYYLDEFEKALQDFNTVITVEPHHTNARMNRGTLSLRMGKYQQAYDDFTEIIGREKGNSEAWLKRGMTILNSNKPSDACADFAEADKLGNTMAKAFLQNYCK